MAFSGMAVKKKNVARVAQIFHSEWTFSANGKVSISSPFWKWMSSKIERAFRKVCATFDDNMRLKTV